MVECEGEGNSEEEGGIPDVAATEDIMQKLRMSIIGLRRKPRE